MSLFSFLENPLGTIESWGSDLVSKGSDFVSSLAHGNIGGALGDLGALATNLTPMGAAMNAFTGGSLQDSVFHAVNGATHGDLNEALAGVVDTIFATSPGLALLNDVLDGKPVQWADGVLGVTPIVEPGDYHWPGAAPTPCTPSADTLDSYGRANRVLAAISTQQACGGPVVRLPTFAAGVLLQHDPRQLPNPTDTQFFAALHPPAETPPLWSMDDTLEVAGMLAFAIPEGGAVISAGINAIGLLRRNIEKQDPAVDGMMLYLDRSFQALQDIVAKDLKNQEIGAAVTFFRAKQAAVLGPFTDALKSGAIPSKDLLAACQDVYAKGEDALSPLMYDYDPIGRLAVPPTVAEYSFRAWIDCANTYLLCMKVGCLLSAVADLDWSDLAGALKARSLTERIASSPDAYRYFQKINALLGTSKAPFRRHLQLTLTSMHQKLGNRLALITPIGGDAALATLKNGWQVATDAGLGGGDASDGFLVDGINWPRRDSEAADHLVRGASADSPPKALWSRPGAFAVGTKDTLAKNVTAYTAMIVNRYAAAYNYDVGTAAAPASMATLVGGVAAKWWGDATSLWQSLTTTLATYQLRAQQTGDVQPFWDSLDVPSRASVKAMVHGCANTLRDARAQGATGLQNAGVAAVSAADTIATNYSWGVRAPQGSP